jgi:hypothetical protein
MRWNKSALMIHAKVIIGLWKPPLHEARWTQAYKVNFTVCIAAQIIHYTYLRAR